MPKVKLLSAPQNEVRFIQIIVAPFTVNDTQSYSTLGLSREGKVYRYDPHCEGWIPWPMKIVDCRQQHKARR